MSKTADLGDYLVLIATDFVPELMGDGNYGTSNLLTKFVDMRTALEGQGVTFPACRIRDDVNIASHSVQIIWDGKLAWEKGYVGIDVDTCSTEVVEQIRQYALANKTASVIKPQIPLP